VNAGSRPPLLPASGQSSGLLAPAAVRADRNFFADACGHFSGNLKVMRTSRVRGTRLRVCDAGAPRAVCYRLGCQPASPAKLFHVPSNRLLYVFAYGVLGRVSKNEKVNEGKNIQAGPSSLVFSKACYPEIGATDHRGTGITRQRGALSRTCRQHQSVCLDRRPVWLLVGETITIRQSKTGKALIIPIIDELRTAIDAMPTDHLTFLTTARGKPFTPAGFTNYFREHCREAGLAIGLSAHGLRKAMCRRLAEAGCSANEVAAISGHQTLREVERYTKAADQQRMARAALERLKKDRVTNREKSSYKLELKSLKLRAAKIGVVGAQGLEPWTR
jgi:Phage integrase family